MTATPFTKQNHIMQYTEVVFYRDGIEIARDRRENDHLYDIDPVEAMTEDEIEDYA